MILLSRNDYTQTQEQVEAVLAEAEQGPAQEGPDPLSGRELEVLRLLAAGTSNQEIAQRLVMTVGTVKWHVNHIYGKLGVHSRTQAIVQAKKLKLLQFNNACSQTVKNSVRIRCRLLRETERYSRL